MSKCPLCRCEGKARVEYIEALRPLQKRIAGQRAELRRLQAFEAWYSKYAMGIKQSSVPVERCKHNVVIDPTGNYVCMKCFREQSNGD